jgi:uncharacterized protein (UPF0264 family)
MSEHGVVRKGKFYSEFSMQTTTPTANDNPERTSGLLVSVQNSSELLVALAAGVRWIDVKDPSRGALGRPEIDVAKGIRRLMTIENATDLHFSIALGELNETPSDELIQYASSFDEQAVFKIALANCLHRTDWRAHALSLAKGIGAPHRLILVHYADATQSVSPDWSEVLRVATELGSQYLLIDTWGKNGSRLSDFYAKDTLQSMIAEAKGLGIKVAIAGSLSLEDLRELSMVGAEWIGVRGAVCKGPLRRDSICATKVRKAISELAWGLTAPDHLGFAHKAQPVESAQQPIESSTLGAKS